MTQTSTEASKYPVQVQPSYWLETLGCPKNQVDSDKLVGTLVADGYQAADSPEQADLVVVNTCAFIEAARQESVDTILEMADSRRSGSRLVVTGCMAERHGDELAAALPEVDLVAGFGVPVTLGLPRKPVAGGSVTTTSDAGKRIPVTVGSSRSVKAADLPGAAARTGAAGQAIQSTHVGQDLASFDLLNLPRPAGQAPWAYIKVAEGCDRHCGFCAIPSFRGQQRSRTMDSILSELEALGPDVKELVLVAQDLASWGIDRSDPNRRPRTAGTPRPIVDMVRQTSAQIDRVRLLYLYPSALDDALIEAILDTGVPYFDLSLQHVSRPLVERMRRWGEGSRYLDRIAAIRRAAPEAAFRSSFILGYPGETEEDHDQLLEFLEEAQLDWAGFFTFSPEPGTYATELDGAVAGELALERLRECSEIQDRITADRRAALVGSELQVLVDSPGVGRTHREAPEIDGVVTIPTNLAPGTFHKVVATSSAGPDLWADPVKNISVGAGVDISVGAGVGASVGAGMPAGGVVRT